MLSAAPIGEAAVEFIRAGGDLCLICHREDYVVAGLRSTDQNGGTRFEVRAPRCGVCASCAGIQEEIGQRLCVASKPPSDAVAARLSRRLWEFSEEVRLAPFSRASGPAASARDEREGNDCGRGDEWDVGRRD